MPKNEDMAWLLPTDGARELYRDISARLAPITPFLRYGNIAARWLSFDAVRGAMRAAGVEEAYITGDASDFERLEALLSVIHRLAGHRALAWCRHDLSHTFDCALDLTPENAESIWQHTALKLEKSPISNPLVFAPVSALVTLERGVKHAAAVLAAAEQERIENFSALCATYCHILDRFAAAGGKAVALAVDPAMPFVSPNEYHADKIFVRALQKDGRGITVEEKALFFAQVVRFFGKECVRRGLALQLQIQRQTCCGEAAVPLPITDIGGLAALLQYLSDADALPRTLLAARNADELRALSPLFTAFAAVASGEPRISPLLAIKSCFEPAALRAELASLTSLVPLGALTFCLDEPRDLVRDVLLRVLCDLLAEQCEKDLLAGGRDAALALLTKILA